MARFTNEQYKKWNEGNKNGFRLDARRLANYGDKESIKYIELGNDSYLKVTICYYPERSQNISEYGCKFTVETGRHIPTVYLSVWQGKGDMMTSHGLGKWIPWGEPQTKKNYKLLQAITGTITNEMMLKINDEYREELKNKYHEMLTAI